MEPRILIQGRLGKRRIGGSVSADSVPTSAPASDMLARRLALAHYIEKLIEEGRLRNYAEAATMLGVTRTRVSQLMDLVLLPADLQEAVLLGKTCSSERQLRASLWRAGDRPKRSLFNGNVLNSE